MRQFVFSSALQRMSVLTRRLGDKELVLFCKGSPEMIISLSEPDSGEWRWAPGLFLLHCECFVAIWNRLRKCGLRRTVYETISYKRSEWCICERLPTYPC